MHEKSIKYIYVFQSDYLWSKYNLDRYSTHPQIPQFTPTGIRTRELQIMNSTFKSKVNARFKPWGLINFMVHNHPSSNRERGEIKTINLLNILIWMGKLIRV